MRKFILFSFSSDISISCITPITIEDEGIKHVPRIINDDGRSPAVNIVNCCAFDSCGQEAHLLRNYIVNAAIHIVNINSMNIWIKPMF